MVDWFYCVINIVHKPINSGSLICVEPSGEVGWCSPRRLVVCGSHEANITVRSVGGDGQGNATQLEISGNPSKFLQGHNLVGSSDLLALGYDTFMILCKILKLQPNDIEKQHVKQGKYWIKNIHYNKMFSLPTREDVRSWLRAGEFKAKSRHGRSTLKRGTLYFGATSSRWKLACYCKADEINEGKTHYLPDQFRLPEVLHFIDNKLRVELRLFSTELHDLQLHEAYKLTPEKLDELFNKYVGSLEMNDQLELTDDKLMNIPKWVQSTYLLWRSGHDLRSRLPKNTYYRHRRELLVYNIDINLPCDRSEHASNVIVLKRVLEAKPCEIPNIFFDRGFIHRSAKRA